MSIIFELQKEAIDSNTDVLSLLRKALLVSKKLGLKEFEEWVNNELNGYDSFEKLPKYRMIYGEVKAANPAYGWIPVIINSKELERAISLRKITNSIPSLINLLSSGESHSHITLSPDFTNILNRDSPFRTNYVIQISNHTLGNIIEQVKNKILDWSILLEENGILGEEISFSKDEKDRANNDPQIINYISNFYGNVENSPIQQGTENSKQEQINKSPL